VYIDFLSGNSQGQLQEPNDSNNIGIAPGSLGITMVDFNADSRVHFQDFLLFAQAFQTKKNEEGFHSKFDLDGDDAINFTDFLLFAQAFK